MDPAVVHAGMIREEERREAAVGEAGETHLVRVERAGEPVGGSVGSEQAVDREAHVRGLIHDVGRDGPVGTEHDQQIGERKRRRGEHVAAARERDGEVFRERWSIAEAVAVDDESEPLAREERCVRHRRGRCGPRCRIPHRGDERPRRKRRLAAVRRRRPGIVDERQVADADPERTRLAEGRGHRIETPGACGRREHRGGDE